MVITAFALLHALIPEPGAIYIMDRAYLDFQRLYNMHQSSAIFVTRSKTDTGLPRLYSNKVDKTNGVRCGQIVVPTGFYTKKDYPSKLRRIKYFDTEKGRTFIFLANQLTLPALTITNLHRYRWRVEILFKWVKTGFFGPGFFTVFFRMRPGAGMNGGDGFLKAGKSICNIIRANVLFTMEPGFTLPSMLRASL